MALADGTPIGSEHVRRYAWFGDDLFAPHLLSVLCDRGCRIQMVFHEPVLSWEIQCRKALARHAEAVIAAELSARCGAVPHVDEHLHDGTYAARPVGEAARLPA